MKIPSIELKFTSDSSVLVYSYRPSTTRSDQNVTSNPYDSGLITQKENAVHVITVFRMAVCDWSAYVTVFSARDRFTFYKTNDPL